VVLICAPLHAQTLVLPPRPGDALTENPEKKIYHTMQVERNGFIHSMVTGTPNEGKGYEYFGPRAYSKWIQPEPPGKEPDGERGSPAAKRNQ
jgi:hypothetical protein